MDQNIQEILSKSIYSQGADLLTKRTLFEICQFNSRFDGSAEWQDQVLALADTFHRLGQGISVIYMVVLAIIEDRWEELDYNWRSYFDDDFYVFVFKKYGRKPKTVNADLRAVRTFVLGSPVAKPFGTVEIPKRTVSGDIEKNDQGEPVTQLVEWDPLQTDLAKLKVAVPLVEQGKMDRKTWSMIMDDKVSSSEMVKRIYENNKDEPHPPQLGIKYRMEGPILVAYENGTDEVELGELDWEGYYGDPYSLKHRAMDKLMELLGITLDELVTMYRAKETENAYYHDD